MIIIIKKSLSNTSRRVEIFMQFDTATIKTGNTRSWLSIGSFIRLSKQPLAVRAVVKPRTFFRSVFYFRSFFLSFLHSTHYLAGKYARTHARTHAQQQHLCKIYSTVNCNNSESCHTFANIDVALYLISRTENCRSFNGTTTAVPH